MNKLKRWNIYWNLLVIKVSYCKKQLSVYKINFIPQVIWEEEKKSFDNEKE